MTLLDDDDRAQMAADLVEVHADNQASVVFRRGSTSLDAQSVRIARLGGQALKETSAGAQETKARVMVAGATDLDVQIGDRFTSSEILYEVSFVRPNRTVDTVAEAFAVE